VRRVTGRCKGNAITMGGNLAEKEQMEAGPVPSGASIRVLRGFYEGLEVPIDRDWMVIGRGRSADMVIAEPTISRAHAAIGYEEGRFFMQDLGSTNGTRVNGAREGRLRLSDGDEMRLGKLRLRVNLPIPA
jgi:pSer/pThr/pTyr-binding forkhead associated (FHA) protein